MISIVIPLMNEEQSLAVLFEKLMPICNQIGDYEIVFVNDGSVDNTLNHLLEWQKKYPEIVIVDLSRNFGKEAALMAGLAKCRGNAAITIDADLQDPPELIHSMILKWREGYEIVSAIRSCRKSDSFLKRLTAQCFYSIFNKISDIKLISGEGDFKLFDRKAINALLTLPERARFNKGLFNWIGFKVGYVSYVRQPRAVGSSKWNYRKLFRFALDGFISFSNVPLKIWIYMGIISAILSFFYAIYIFFKTLIIGVDVPGYASIVTSIFFIGGLILSGIGILGEYIGRIFEETKQRPLYIIRDVYGNDKKKKELE